MSVPPNAMQAATTDFSRALLTQIAQLVGRSPDSFKREDDHRQESDTAALLAIWYELSPHAQDRLLILARDL